MEKYINLETHVRPNDSMSLMTIKEMLEKYTDGYSKEAQVELVRCHYCQYYDTDTNYCHTHNSYDMEQDDFCSYGERKG